MTKPWKSVLLAISIACFGSSVSANESGWSNVQFIFANSFASQNPSGIGIRLSVIDRTGPFVTPLDRSDLIYTVSGPGIGSRSCSITEQFGDYLRNNFFGVSVVNNGFEEVFDFPACNGHVAATITIYCPAGSISHSDDDTSGKLTANDGTHTFTTFREEEYSDSFGMPETRMCSLTFSDAAGVYSVPIDSLRLVDRDIRFN